MLGGCVGAMGGASKKVEWENEKGSVIGSDRFAVIFQMGLVSSWRRGSFWVLKRWLGEMRSVDGEYLSFIHR